MNQFADNRKDAAKAAKKAATAAAKAAKKQPLPSRAAPASPSVGAPAGRPTPAERSAEAAERKVL